MRIGHLLPKEKWWSPPNFRRLLFLPKKIFIFICLAIGVLVVARGSLVPAEWSKPYVEHRVKPLDHQGIPDYY